MITQLDAPVPCAACPDLIRPARLRVTLGRLTLDLCGVHAFALLYDLKGERLA